MKDLPHIASARQEEIVQLYLAELDKHMNELKLGQSEKTLEIKDFAEKLFIHPTHLSNTLHEVLGKSPCDIYEEKLISIAKELIVSTKKPIGHIAEILTFDPSNFTKFFKSHAGVTPKKFREMNRNTEVTAI